MDDFYKKKIVIIGATSSIAIYCMRKWIQDPIDLTLVGRDLDRLEEVASDMKTRSPNSKVSSFKINFVDVNEIKSLVVQ